MENRQGIEELSEFTLSHCNSLKEVDASGIQEL
jgi:hypothetical protein